MDFVAYKRILVDFLVVKEDFFSSIMDGPGTSNKMKPDFKS